MVTSGSASLRSTRLPVAMSKLNQVLIDGIRKSLVQAGAGVLIALAPFICFYLF